MGKGYTLITNGIRLSEYKLEKFMEAGLDSLTCSVDINTGEYLNEGNLQRKSDAGYIALKRAKEMGIRDACAVITLTHENLPFVIDNIRELSKLGIWVSLDPIHYKHNGVYDSSPDREEISQYLFQITDLAELRKIVRWIKANRDKIKVFQSDETLDYFTNESVLDLNWSCVTEEYRVPTSLTVGADGSLSACDNFFSPKLSKYSIFDVEDPDIWKMFKEEYCNTVIDAKCSCLWTTHIEAQRAFKNGEKLEHFIHK